MNNTLERGLQPSLRVNLLVWVLEDGHKHLGDVPSSKVGHPRPGHRALLVQCAVMYGLEDKKHVSNAAKY